MHLKKSDIAVVGIGCRFPDADNYNELWENIICGTNSVKEIPPARWNAHDYYSADILEPNKTISRWCGMIDGIDLFDNRFFNISPREAAKMDPQQRLLMEEAWHCIEDSGLPVYELQKRKTGVFVGVQAIDYMQVTSQLDIPIDNYNILGNYECVLANRVSHTFGLQGKSMALDAACASSLYAVNEARYSLITGEIDYALVGGVCLLHHPMQYLALSKGRMLSSQGRCKSFDGQADGFVPGEGVAVLLLQRLPDAQKTGSHIYGLIKGSAANHNGSTESITAPGVDAQRDVVVQAYRDAGINPEFTTYIEAHGVGSFLGDAAELVALSQAFGMFSKSSLKCKIGTLKGNIGHLEAASGIAGIIKVLMMMRHRRIPPTLNFQNPNPLLKFEETPFELVTEPCDWDAKDGQDEFLRAGVSAFGFAGSNGHVILESYPQITERREDAKHPKKVNKIFGSKVLARDRSAFKNSGGGLVTLSAKSPQALEALIEKWIVHTKGKAFENAFMMDICGTLLTGREHFPYRCGWYVDKKEQLASKLINEDLEFVKVPRGEERFGCLIVGDMVQKRNSGSSEIFFPNNAFSARIKKTYQYLQIQSKMRVCHDVNEVRHAFITGYALGMTMLDLGFRPSLIAGEGSGFLIALAISGMLDPADAHAIILGKSDMNAISLHRPSVPFYDPVCAEIRFPYVIDEAYLIKLMDPDAIRENDARECIQSAKLMAKQQLIFNNFLHEWDSALQKIGLKSDQLIEDDTLLPVDNEACRRELVLLLVMIVSSMQKLRRKWEMPGHCAPSLRTLDELSNLVVDRVFAKEEFIQLLFRTQADVSKIARRCNDRQHLLDSHKHYTLLKKNSETLWDIPDPTRWIKKGIDEDLAGLEVKTARVLTMGHISPEWLDGRTDAFRLEDCNDKSVKKALLYLWNSGVDICWDKLYPIGSFKRVNLPSYPYQRQPFWLTPMQRKTHGNHAPAGQYKNISSLSPEGNEPAQSGANGAGGDPESMKANQKQVENVVCDICAQLLQVPAEELDANMSFDEYGVDSIMMIEFLDRLELLLSNTIQPDALTEYNTIRKLTAFLNEEKEALMNGGKIAKSGTEGQAQNAAHAREPVNTGAQYAGGSRSEANSISNGGNDIKIAVIGMGCRFPESRDIDSFWRNLHAGRFLITEVPSSRWNISEYYSPDKATVNKTYCKWGGFINDIELFDADFFGVSEDDAPIIDPQHRILLELTQHVLDQAGYTQKEINGARIGVYIGGSESTYVDKYWHRLSNHQMKRVSVSRISNMMAARISDFYNFKSASQTLDTACSSSLVAIHRACEHIRSGECEMAIAGGIELLLDPRTYIEFSKGGMLSDDGKMYVFDKQARGFVPGEGAGLVLLKSYAQALKDGDAISAIILGSAVNNDGHTLGVTVPDKKGQAEVITMALEQSGITPDTISYFEAHGTGTLLGDPIEIKAATEVYSAYTSEKQFCAVGSVKSNMGHLVRAAGVAGFIKVALGLHHRQIPPTLNCNDVHPRFRFNESPFYAVTGTETWQPRHGVWRAAISSFGFGGTNCHMILEGFEPSRVEPYDRKRHPLPLTRFNRKRFWLGEPVAEVDTPGFHGADEHVASDAQDIVANVSKKDFKLDWHQGFVKAFVYGDAILSDHQVFGVQTLLGAVHSSLAIHTAGKNFPGSKIKGLRKVTFSDALKIFPLQRFQVTVNLRIDGAKILFENRYNQGSRPDPSVSKLAASGEITLDTLRSVEEPDAHHDQDVSDNIDLKQWRSSASFSVSGEEFYHRQKTYGKSLFSIRQVYFSEDSVLSHIVLTPVMRSDFQPYLVNPAIFDAGHITLLHAASLIDSIDQHPFVPLFIREINLFEIDAAASRELYCRVRITKKTDEMVYADMVYYDGNGKRLMSVSGYCSRRVSSPQALGIAGEDASKSEPVTSDVGASMSADLSAGIGEIPEGGGLKAGIEDYVIGKLRDTMDQAPDRFPVDKNFLELGLDSNNLIKLAPVMEKEVGIEVYPTLFFEHQSIKELAAFFLSEHREAFERYLAAGGMGSAPEYGKIENRAAPAGSTPVISTDAKQPIFDPGAIRASLSGDPSTETNDLPERGGLQHGIEDYLIGKLRDTMDQAPDRFPVDKNFLELGLDSNNLIKLAPVMEKEIGIEVYPTLFFEHQNIKELAAFFLSEHGDAFARYLTAGGMGPAAQNRKIENQADRVATNSVIHDYVGGSEPRPSAESNFAPTIEAATSLDADYRPQDIAVIGMSGRFAASETLDQFWTHIKNGEDLIREIPAERWDRQSWFDKDPQSPNKTYSKWGSFINDVDKFDAAFFGIGPQQAIWMDPQQRMLLEIIHSCIEDAGLAGKIKGTDTGFYLGVCFHDYGNEIVRAGIPIVDYQYNSTIYSITAGFISYWYDLQGPCIPLDNACASSLTALHLACKAIQTGECDMAFVAGANLILSPLHYVHFSRVQALSPTGRCRAFDSSADGYVPGEGVAAILLKPLHKAIADNDNIHAVVRGTAINHVGRSNNPTAPRPELQTKLLLRAWQHAGINPETLGYLETHGTGTKLGDPVEINAIKKAFQSHTRKKQFCTLGSTKTNIGHLEGAAGIASLIKAILAIRHGWIPVMPTFKDLNPYIQLEDSPLRINTQAEPWERNGGMPRRAGVSAFGMTGNNAHVVVEEYIRKETFKPQIALPKRDTSIIVLSARNENRLISQARRLLSVIKERRFTDHDLPDIAYTLQVGREAMEERVALMTGSLTELEEKLAAFVARREDIEKLYHGQAGHHNRVSELFTTEEGLQRAMDKWFHEATYAKLLELWVKGLVVDWDRLYGDIKPRRISLPTYPFAGERYWIPENDGQSAGDGATAAATAAFLHPLLHRNTSNHNGERFSTTFTGREFFLANHIVKGRKVLPGVVHVEMARAAVSYAAGISHDDRAAIKFEKIVWASPIAVGDRPKSVHITLSPQDNGRMDYEIHGPSEADDGAPVVYSQGRSTLISKPDVPALDLKSLLAECSMDRISPRHFYAQVKESGLSLGPGFQGIEMLYVGSEQVLAKLALPSSVADTLGQFVLHPSLMDSLIQTSIGLMMASGVLMGAGDRKLVLPFVTREIEVINACTAEMWSVVRYSQGSKASDAVPRFDLDLCDDQGNLCVRMKGLSVRFLESEIQSLTTTDTLMVRPFWKERTIFGNNSDASTIEYAQHVVLLCETSEKLRESISVHMQGARCLSMHSGEKRVDERFQAYAVRVLEIIQTIMHDKPRTDVLIQIVVPSQEKLLAGLSGLLKTARKENPRLIGQMIEMDADLTSEAIVEMLRENSRCPHDHQIRYENGKRGVPGWVEVDASEQEIGVPWKDDGVYLITGGAGGLGLIFAKEIARKVKGATLILAGRSPSESKQGRLKELAPLDVIIEYRQVDVCRKEAVENLIQSIRDEFGDLNGLVHSAGVIRDNLIFKKTTDELRQVLAPKVSAVVHLDQASKDLRLDFFILFSSIAGVVGNPGQADYAAANAFMDAYAQYRNDLVAANRRHGRSLSINWPLWQAGGMAVDDVTKALIKQNLGLVPMRSSTGIKALYQGFGAQCDQWMVLEGEIGKMRRKLLSTETLAGPEQTVQTVPAPMVIDNQVLREKVQTALIRAVSHLQHIEVGYIDPKKELNAFGFDSIMLNKLANHLNMEFNLELTPTIFFEHPTLNALAQHLAKEYEPVLAGHFDLNLGVETPAATMEVDGARVLAVKDRPTTYVDPISSQASTSETRLPEPIAIVGMSGRFPMAADLNAFWRNLEQGRDCIKEIPKSRWDWQEIYGDPATETNKSNIKWGGFIDGIDEFDPLFFGISPREAELMDPQQRLLMMYVWKAIEDAGYSAQSLSGTQTAIFVGTTSSGYSEMRARANMAIKGYYATGMLPSVGPNRMSYFLNFHGPSEPIETACSSSLIAIHRAVECIAHGTCEAAIVGGVNTIVAPEVHISFNKAGMLCEDGRCKTFSDKANGYVRGEGVGMLFLKKLKAAEKDGDHIYGIIRASAENHGGRANSLTAPNPIAQTELLKKAYTQAGIDPGTVSYIEAHGTGTQLGDPIEINALKAAFEDLHQAAGDARTVKTHCGLGSVKTNIGHLELAAGIAGVIKILLQIKHKTLVKNLHCDTVNPLIQLENSPFYLVGETGPWKKLLDSHGQGLPRCAGVSSFGFGGANAHVVIEEYIAKDRRQPEIAISRRNPAIIVFSAANENRIKEQVRRLLSTLREQRFTERELPNVAYTLQVGREPLKERLAVIVGSIGEIEQKLQGFLDDRADIEDLYRGKVKPNDETLSVFAADEDMAKTIAAWIIKGKYTKLLSLWVKGLDVDWGKLYGDIKPRRISLPTYPFARERHWLPKSGQDQNDSCPESQAVLHPLVQRNTSDLSEQRFSSTFSGKEFFLADHIVAGQRVMPGVAYLEMVRAAMEQAAGPAHNGGSGIRLRNVVWAKPITVEDQAVEVHIGLYPQNGEKKIAYEIYSHPTEDLAAPVVHSRGSAALCPAAEAPILDLAALQAHCSQGRLSSEQCYQAFRAMGIDYGKGHRGVEVVHLGPDKVLAKLSLPASVSHTERHFILHPSLMDSALQAAIGLMIDGDYFSPSGRSSSLRPNLPFALGELEIFGGCRSEMWALCRYSTGCSANDKVRKFDIDLCDNQGKVCVRLKEYSTRELKSDNGAVGTLMLQPHWKEQAVGQKDTAPAYARHLVMLCGLGQDFRENIEKRLGEIRCISLDSEQKGIDKRFEAYACQVLEVIGNILAAKPTGQVLLQIVVCTQNEQQLICGLSGLLKTAGLENTKLIGQLIEVGPKQDSEGITAILAQNSRCPHDWGIRYQGDKRFIAEWREVRPLKAAEDIPWKDGGVYLITGGAGGLGLIFAEDIARHAKDATLILTGRAPLNEDKQARLMEIQKKGARIEYTQTDVTRQNDVSALIHRIRDEFGNLNGIIHGAGVIRDNLIINKTKEELQTTLSPKVSGLVNLDLASKDLALDFFVFFSSVAGAMGNIGQADYSCANAFMDAYAGYRNTLVVSGLRQGKTLSINWPLWKAGGMRVDAQTEKMMRQVTGMSAMQTTTGIRAFHQALASGKEQVLVLEGQLARMRQKFQSASASADVTSAKVSANASSDIGIDNDQQVEKVKSMLIGSVSTLLKVDPEEIDDDVELNEYGFDSIMLTEFANQLNERYKLELAPTLFFEQPTTLNSFAQYLVGEYPGVFAAQFKQHSEAEVAGLSAPEETQENGYRNIPRSRFSGTAVLSSKKVQPSVPQPIAIVGMSGRFPMAEDLNQFWNNLAQGKDCIRQVPKERWDWEEFFGEPKKEPNKTNSKWGGFIRNIDRFDASFFKLSPREATLMDPQQRIFLETVWHCIEDAGYRASALSGTKTGLFVGAASMDYFEIESRLAADVQAHTITGVSLSILANRISYMLNLRGPSEPVDTACSSSLVAIHRAVEHLRAGDCSMAIAGGVNVLLTPTLFISFSKAGMLSKDGRCRTFDRNANGYVRGEGVGAVLLKPLDQALADGDHVYAVIKGSAVNHSGRGSSLTAPNPQAQAELLVTAYQKSGIDPSTVTYIEAHGTGTELGDPIEITGMKRAFAELYRKWDIAAPDHPHCGLGSVKTNIGHLETAAGIAGIIKVLKAMENETLPASLHCKEINPYIVLDKSPFYIATESKPWKRLHDQQGRPLPFRAGVNSFGFGGVNAHVILEELLPDTAASVSTVPIPRELENNADRLIEATAEGDGHQPMILVLSAKSEERLQNYAGNMVTYLRRHFVACQKNGTKGGAAVSGDSLHAPHREPPHSSLGNQYAGLSDNNGKDAQQSLRTTLRQIVSRMVDIDIEEIDTTCELADFGFDPVLLNTLHTTIETRYDLPHLSDEIGINYTINRISDHLLAEYGVGNIDDHPIGPSKFERVTPADPDTLELSMGVGHAVPEWACADYVAADFDMHDDTGPCNIRPLDIVFTLQVGREPLAVRFATVVRDASEMISALETLHHGAPGGDHVYLGTVKKAKSKQKKKRLAKADQAFLSTLLENGELDRIAELWVSGVPIDWEFMYQGKKPKRIPLPTYPFAQERFWLPLKSHRLSTGWDAYAMRDNGPTTSALHPLVGVNTSTFKQACFQTNFSGREFFLRDHRLKGESILPGVAYAEMARVAAESSAAAPIHAIRNLIWLQPLIVKGLTQAEIHLEPKSDCISYKVTAGRGKDQRTCGQGTVMYGKIDGTGEKIRPTDNLPRQSDALAVQDELRTELKKCGFIGDGGEELVNDQNGALYLDLTQVQTRCSHPIKSEDCYADFTSFGLEYGKTFRSIKRLFCGDEEAFSRVSVHPAVRNENHGWHQFVLHPSVMDAALHTVMGSLEQGGVKLRRNPYVPYFLGQLTFTDGLPENSCVYVRFCGVVSGNEKDTAREIRCHIMITDDSGRILVLMREMILREVVFRSLPVQADRSGTDAMIAPGNEKRAGEDGPVHLYRFAWDRSESVTMGAGLKNEDDFPVLVFDINDIVCNTLSARYPADEKNRRRFILVTPAQHYDALADGNFGIDPAEPSHYHQLLEELQKNGDVPGTILHLWSLAEENVAAGKKVPMLEKSIYSLLFLTQSMLRSNQRIKGRKKCRIYYWFSSDPDREFPAFSAVNGFALTANREYPRYHFRTVEVDGFSDEQRSGRLAELIAAEMGTDNGGEIMYRGPSRYVRGIHQMDLDPTANETIDSQAVQLEGKKNNLPVRDDGVYVITGGLGRLGMIFAKAFARQAGVRLALVGRSGANKDMEANIRQLRDLGAQVTYFQGDISKEKDANAIIADIRSSFGRINGIVHAAGVIHDSAVVSKTKIEMDAVLAPKVFGSVNLDLATKDQELDFFALFSSVSAVAGNPGQCDYAYANRFMDTLAEKRQKLVEQGVRHGKTISINWPFWREGGMRIDRETEKMQRDVMGAVPLESGPGIDAFGAIMAARETRVLVISGDRTKLEKTLGIPLRINDGSEEGGLPPNFQPIEKVDSEQGVDHRTVLPGQQGAEAIAANSDIDAEIHNQLIGQLQGKAAEILQVEGAALDPEEYMQDYGFESVTLAEFAAAINDTYDLTLTPAIFFNLDEPTLECLAHYLEAEHNEVIKRYYAPEDRPPGHKGEAEADHAAREEQQRIKEISEETAAEHTRSEAQDFKNEDRNSPFTTFRSKQSAEMADHPFFDEIYSADEKSEETSYEIISRWREMHPVFSHHMVLEKARMPGVGYVEMIYAAARFSMDRRFNQLERLFFQHPIVIDPAKNNMTRICLTPENDTYAVEIRTSETGDEGRGQANREKINATAILRQVPAKGKKVDVETLKKQYSRKVEYSYDFLLRAELGFRIGAYYNSIRNVYITDNETDCSALVEIRLSSVARAQNDKFFLPPGLLDPCAYAAIALINDRHLQTSVKKLYLPVCFEKVQVHGPIGEECLCLIETKEGGEDDSMVSVSISCFNPDGDMLVEMRDVQFKKIEGIKE